ncbi:hypothetical protein OHA79_50455 (plasmid) [Streptomyces sp. NBC_00841]|uniref:hypothetical protein n=1 Tax=unclassified Streptomyces TaxID=2593676 RepID=UPI002252F8AC|nr:MULTISPECIES: hypothetical protein [unclassified Streptomyces]MCX4538506.1 hypothetical protein [Streptomyces sp. NBC_01669]WSA05957.1 hypothetical protein OHA79_50455 [Streptomyces sp. NBC_00841]
MVMLLDGEGDPGAHASDPGAEDWSDGFILENGQNDEYPDEDTVLLSEAFRIVRHIIVKGTPPADAAWTVDVEPRAGWTRRCAERRGVKQPFVLIHAVTVSVLLAVGHPW